MKPKASYFLLKALANARLQGLFLVKTVTQSFPCFNKKRLNKRAPSQNTLGSVLGGYRAEIMDILGWRLDNITTSTAKEFVSFIATVNRSDMDIMPGATQEPKLSVKVSD
jgi:hypothetical protein